jgi:hypothetical protein
MAETRLHSQDSRRGSGCLVDKQSCYLLRKYVYQRMEYVITFLSRTIIANDCNISHSHFPPSHFIVRHKQIINVFKMLSVTCDAIWPFDIRKFSIKTNQEIYRLWTGFMWPTVRLREYCNIIWTPERMDFFDQLISTIQFS